MSRPLTASKRTGSGAAVLFAVVVAAGEAVLLATRLRAGYLPGDGALHLLESTVPLWVAGVAALWWARLDARRGAVVVLGVCAALQLVALLHRPSTSDDAYRYLWDAKVQLAGHDPYRYAPSAPQLAPLRDRSIFGAPDHCQHAFPGGCTSINRPTVHTVYPPVAQLAFDALRLVSLGGRGGLFVVQLFGALGALAVAWLLLRRAGPWLAAIWAWCPVVAIEYTNNAHIDWLAVLLALFALSTRRRWLAGVLAGAAVVVKIYPALIVPSLLRRSWVPLAAAVGLVALSYVPHVLATGTQVIGYLPGYLKEEQYGSGNRLALVGAVLPHPADTIVGALIVGAAAVWALLIGWRDAGGDPAPSAVVVTGVGFLVFTPNFGWYAGLLLALAAFTGALEWVPIALAASFVYDTDNHATLVYGVAGLLALVILLIRRRADLGRRLASSPLRSGPSLRER